MIATAVWAAGAAVLVSPLLAGWTVSLADVPAGRGGGRGRSAGPGGSR